MGRGDGWSEQDLADLRRLWDDLALSASEIGRRLRRSKNSILGKAHRLQLPARENPIGAEGRRIIAATAAPRDTPRAVARPRPARPAQAISAPGEMPARPPSPARNGDLSAQARREAERRALRPLVVGERSPLFYPADLTCQSIEGDLRAGGRFCGAPRVAGRPYCGAHCARAYESLKRAEAA